MRDSYRRLPRWGFQDFSTPTSTSPDRDRKCLLLHQANDPRDGPALESLASWHLAASSAVGPLGIRDRMARMLPPLSSMPVAQSRVPVSVRRTPLPVRRGLHPSPAKSGQVDSHGNSTRGMKVALSRKLLLLNREFFLPAPQSTCEEEYPWDTARECHSIPPAIGAVRRCRAAACAR